MLLYKMLNLLIGVWGKDIKAEEKLENQGKVGLKMDIFFPSGWGNVNLHKTVVRGESIICCDL